MPVSFGLHNDVRRSIQANISRTMISFHALSV